MRFGFRRSHTGTGGIAACTVITRSFLSYARILAESYLEYEPEGRMYVFVVDGLPPEIDAGPGIRVVQPEELELPTFREMCFKYDVVELCTAVKPSLFSLLFDRYGESSLLYFDPDILFMRSLPELKEQLRDASIVLTPHILTPIPLDRLEPSEKVMLVSGAYNLGFLGLTSSDESRRFLEWWHERLLDECRVDVPRGLFVDQKWVDLVPSMFPSTSILRDETYNVAFWNLHERKLERRGPRFFVNGRPVTFFHFSGFDPSNRLALSKHQNRVEVAPGTPLADLLGHYADLHMKHGYEKNLEWEYGYSRLTNGIRVNSALRRLFLSLDDEARSRFGDPFDAESSDSFLEWAARPRSETGELSRFLETLYRLREDLVAAFPDVQGKDREAFLHWARTYGPGEMGYEPELVRDAEPLPAARASRAEGAPEAAPADATSEAARAVSGEEEAPSTAETAKSGAERAEDRYRQLVEEVRDLVETALPPGATAAVVSRGDDDLLSFERRTGWHFPQTPDGIYSGHYPADSSEAIALLEEVRERGAEFLVFPRTAFWWLDHYLELARHLDTRYPAIVRREDACLVYALAEQANVEARPSSSAEGPLCSIVIPTSGRAALLGRCLTAILEGPSSVDFEVIVVDDGSEDETRDVLGGWGDRVRVVRHARNLGFATSCNDGAAIAAGSYLVFVDDDAIPQPGWLDALVQYAEDHPRAAVVGCKLLFPDETIQHAGVVVCQDGVPRPLYAGLQPELEATNTSRRFQIVTASCALFRCGPFDEVGGFDPGFRKRHADNDLCLRLGRLGNEIHYCHESVVSHLALGVAEENEDDGEDLALFRSRWSASTKPDDLAYYLEDGLLHTGYSTRYPLDLSIAPVLGVIENGEANRIDDVLANRSQQAFEVLKQAVRLRARAEAAELRANGNGAAPSPPEQPPRLLCEAELHWLQAEPEGPLVSVLLPAAGESARLGELLSSLLGQRARACLELLALGAGAEADRERLDLLRSFGAGLLLFEPERFSLARARALAALRARGELVVLLGPGVVPADADWLAALLAPLARDPQLAAVCSRLLPDPAADPLARRRLLAAPSAQAESQRLHGRLRRPLPFQSESLALRADVLRRLPPPPEGGDERWAEQLLAAGLELAHEPASVALARPPAPALAGEAERELLAGLREDWRYLERECELPAAELEEWRLRAALRRAIELLWLEGKAGHSRSATTPTGEVTQGW